MPEIAKKPLKIIPLEKRLMLDASLAGIVGQILWLDGADAATIVDSDGDNAATGTGGNNDGFSGFVAEWLDKSGNSNDQAATGTETPAYALTTQNGNNVLTFDGINDQITGTATATGAELTIFAVYEMTGNSPGGRGDVIDLGQNSPQRTTLGVENGSNPTAISVGGGFGANFNDYSGTYGNNTFYINTLIHNGANFTGFINANNVLNSTAGTRQTSSDIHIGNDSTGGNNFNGNIAEIIVYERELTSDERHDVETYLAGKWGLTTTNATPTVVTNTGVTLNQGDFTTFTNTMLSSSDTDNSNANLIYTVTDAVDNGTLTNTNTSTTLTVNSTFRQSDIDNGYIQFTHNNSFTPSDAFSFTVTDNEATTTAATFDFTITPSVLTGLNAIPNPVFHYDAQDLDGDKDFSDQPANGTAIGTVINPTGTIQNATQSGGQRPIYNENAFDIGKGGLVFDGTDDHLDVPNNILINDTGPWDEKSFAVAFRTGSDVVTNQVIYEQGGASNGYNLGIWNGDLIAYVWAESYWGGGDQYKSVNLGAVDADTTYSVIIIHDATGVTLNDRTFSANVNGGAFTSVNRADAQGAHIGNIVIGRGDDTHNPLDDSGFSGAGNFNGAIGELWNWNHALDSAQITEVENYMQGKWFGSQQTLDTNNAITVNEGGSITLSNTDLDTNDVESADTAITYTVTATPTTGALQLGGVVLNVNDTFTQDDINSGLISYNQNGTDASSDTFNFSVSDGFSMGTNGTFTFNITNINDAPTLSDNAASFAQGGTITLTTAALNGTDVDNVDNGLIYEITSIANDGVLALNGVALGLNDTFTNQNVTDGLITYTHNNIATANDTFDVTVTDGALTSAFATITLNIDLSLSNLTNVNTVEGGDVNIGNGDLEYVQPVSGWFDANWQYRREITVDHTQVDSDLTDYNLLVTGDGLTADFWSNVQNDGGDIVVTDASGNKLDRELVSIDTVGQTLQLYVRTDLSSTIDTQFYIYYGNASATETNDATTWDSNFTGVWHFDDDFSDGDVADSSQSNNDAATRGGFNNSNLATGVVGGAGQFNNGEYLALNYAYNGNNSLPAVSLSAWINTTDTSGGLSDNWAVIDFDRSEFFNVYIRNGAIGFSTSDNGSINDQTGGSGLNNGAWQHITAVYDGTDKILYANGIEVDREVNVHGGDNLGRGTRFGFIGDGSEATSFDGGRNNVYYDGQFDNIRLYEGTLGDAWIAAEYRNQSNPSTFYSVGGQIVQPNNVSYIITNNVDNGTLYIDANTNGILDSGEAIGLGSTFTQTDIDMNMLRYAHNGGETTADTYSFTVNNGILTSGENTMTINVTPVNDNPTNISLSNNSVLNSEIIGTVIGALSTSDVDLPGDSFTYSILSDPDGKFTIAGNQLILNSTVSFSVSEAHDVTIQTDDGNGGLFNRLFTIDVERPSNGVNILPDAPDITVGDNVLVGNNDVQKGLSALIGSFVRGEQSTQLQAFYGENSLGQIIKTNVTTAISLSLGGDINNIQNMPQTSDDVEQNREFNEGVNSKSHYTRMIEFLKMTSEFADESDTSPAEKNEVQKRNLPNQDNVIAQFEDVQIYNEKRSARLMEALSQIS